MKQNESVESFAEGSVSKVVLKNVLPAMAAQLMVLVYNLADTFFIAQTRNDYMVASVSDLHVSGNPVRHWRHFGDLPCAGCGQKRVCPKGQRLLYVGLCHCRRCADGFVLGLHGSLAEDPGCQRGYHGIYP